jgi:hypothetical protein
MHLKLDLVFDRPFKTLSSEVGGGLRFIFPTRNFSKSK